MEPGSGDKSNSAKESIKSNKIQHGHEPMNEVNKAEKEDGTGDVRSHQPPTPEVKPQVEGEVDCEAVIKKHLAAIKIQSAFRGWLVRANLKMVTECCIKMQAVWRGALVRNRNRRKKSQKGQADIQRQKQQSNSDPADRSRNPSGTVGGKTTQPTSPRSSGGGNNAAENAQSPGTGRISVFDKGHLDDCHPSSDSLRFSSDGEADLMKIRMEAALKCLETILKDACGEDLNRISKTRVTELVEYLGTNPNATKDDICLENSLARLCPLPPPVEKEETGEDDEGGPVQPDPEKVRLLRDAIRLLREKIRAWENRKLYRYHHLARTKAIPGIYSDPFSGELTEVEKKLKDLRFDWKDADSYVSPAKFKTENTKQLKELMVMDPDEKETLEKIYKFNFKYFPEEINNVNKPTVLIQVPQSPPPFTTLFKANPKRRR